MCKVISIVNQKGGCSKTTSAVNIGIGLANAGKKVVLIDADAQGSLTASLGFQKPDELKVTLATIMAKTINEEEIDFSKVILHGILKYISRKNIVEILPLQQLTATLNSPM